MSSLKNRGRARIFVLVAVGILIVAVTAENPGWWGVLSPSGRVPMLVGTNGVGISRSGGPLWLSVKTKCISRADGWIQPYSRFEIDANCAEPISQLVFPRLIVGIDGKDSKTTPDDFTATLDPLSLSLRTGEKLISEEYLSGYIGIDETAFTPPPPVEGYQYTSNVRYVAQNKHAVVRVLHCLMNRRIRERLPQFEAAACFGSGMYRGVIVDVQFDLTLESTEQALTAQIQSVLDGMLD